MIETEPITDWETSSATDDVAVKGAEPAPEPKAPKAAIAAEPVADPAEPAADAETDAPVEPSRDEHGKFTRRGKRHSAKNQATAEDVPRIRELTKQNAELAAQLEAAKTPKPVEPAAPVAAAPTPSQTPAPVVRPSGPAQAFPDFATWLAQEGNDQKSYDDYTDARADWRWQVNHQQAQQQTHAETRDKAFREQIAASRQKYQDYDALAFAPTLPITAVMRHAMLESDRGAEILYHLGKNPALAQQIAQGSQFSGPDAMPPMRWYLESLVPVEAVARNEDAKVGSSLALVKKPGPKPPNPTRTQGTLKSGDQAPGDDDSLEDHEAYFHRAGRRRR